jgi:hypothetical protein
MKFASATAAGDISRAKPATAPRRSSTERFCPQFEFGFASNDRQLETHNGAEKRRIGLRGHGFGRPTGLPLAFVAIGQFLDDTGDEVDILTNSSRTIRMNDGVVPGRYRWRIGIPGGRDVGMWPLEDRHGFGMPVHLPPMPVSSRDMANDVKTGSDLTNQHGHMGRHQTLRVGRHHEGDEVELPHEGHDNLAVFDSKRRRNVQGL